MQPTILYLTQLLSEPNSETAVYLFGEEALHAEIEAPPTRVYAGPQGHLRYLVLDAQGRACAMARVLRSEKEVAISEFYVTPGEQAATIARQLARQMLLDFPMLRKRTGRRELPSVASYYASQTRAPAKSGSWFSGLRKPRTQP